MTKTLKLTSAVAFALAIGSAGPALAGQARSGPDVDVLGQRVDPESLTVRVSFADLDLTSANDQDRLTSRVRGAVRQVCAPIDTAGQRIEHTYCGYVAWNGARPQMERAFAQARLAARGVASDTAVASIVVAVPKF